MKPTSWSTGLSMTGDGVGVVAHAGSVATRLLADETGLTAELSKTMVLATMFLARSRHAKDRKPARAGSRLGTTRPGSRSPGSPPTSSPRPGCWPVLATPTSWQPANPRRGATGTTSRDRAPTGYQR